MKQTHVFAVSTALLFAGILAAAPKPNFTGEWKMIPSKSDYGSMEAPQSVTRKVVHEEPNLTVTAIQKGTRGEMTTEFKYATDGKEYLNKTRLGDARSVLTWEGDTLMITTKRKIMGRDIVIADHWSMAPDGKTMTVSGKLSGGARENEYKVTFEKQQ